MAETVTDPLEKAVLSGALFAGPDPDGPERRANGQPDSDDDHHNDAVNGSEQDDDDDDDDSGLGFLPPNEVSNSSSVNGPVRTTKGQSHNTGVKGVLADYKNRNNPSWRQDGNDSDNQDDGEREAREAYRKKRIAEMMQMGSNERSDTISGPRYKGKFGQLREVGQDQFLRATEAQDGTLVIVHVYSDVSMPAYARWLHAPADVTCASVRPHQRALC